MILERRQGGEEEDEDVEEEEEEGEDATGEGAVFWCVRCVPPLVSFPLADESPSPYPFKIRRNDTLIRVGNLTTSLKIL